MKAPAKVDRPGLRSTKGVIAGHDHRSRLSTSPAPMPLTSPRTRETTTSDIAAEILFYYIAVSASVLKKASD